MAIAGGCHCGNIRLTLSGMPGDTIVAARECGCSFCSKHGGLWTAHPAASLALLIARPGEVARYAFGTKSADFHVCRVCVVVPLVTSSIEGRLYAVVSVRALEGIDLARIERRAADFEGEALATRLARRVRGWIPQVTFAPPAAAP
jgi:hypothetical protein